LTVVAANNIAHITHRQLVILFVVTFIIRYRNFWILIVGL